MTRNRKNKGTHLAREERFYIEDALKVNYPLKKIAEYLGKDPTTISKEVKRNRISSMRLGSIKSIGCAKRRKCTFKNLCSNTCNRLCKKCSTVNCYRSCPEYVPETCGRLDRFPHVCNGCEKKMGCRLEKQNYRARVANAKYKDTLSDTRKGIAMTPEELNQLDNLISPLIKKGQSIAHIYSHHSHEISCCERTLYTYVGEHLFTARNIDLPRKVRYKPRRKTNNPPRNTTYRKGRTYDDFCAYIQENPGVPVVEMDTVYGSKGGKVLLTLFFRVCSLMVAFLLDECTQICVQSAINHIYAVIGSNDFKACFPVILTDNGAEFQAPELIEYDEYDNERTKVFYCDPMASYQKPHIEKNHEYIRYVLPKGQSFNHLTQEKVTLMINHINSTARTSLNRNTPIKLAQLLLKQSFLYALSLESINHDDVHLKPALLR